MSAHPPVLLSVVRAAPIIIPQQAIWTALHSYLGLGTTIDFGFFSALVFDKVTQAVCAKDECPQFLCIACLWYMQNM